MFLWPLLVVAACAAYASWRTRCTRRRLRIKAFVVTAVTVQALLIVPVGYGTASLHQVVHPRDDWYDIAGFTGAFVQCGSLPFVAVITWWIAHRLERARRGRTPAACGACGYELPGPPLQRCPECGARPTRDGARS